MKRTVIAGLLSLLYPGLGQLYTGRRLRGVLFIVGELIITFINSFSGFLDLIFYGVYLWAFVDAVLLARKSEDQQFLRGLHFTLEVGLAAVISLSLMYGAQFLGEWSLKQLLYQEKSSQELQKVKKETEQYLEKKYEERFRIEKVKYIYEVGNYDITAFPKNHPEMKFGVSCNEEVTSFEDRYPYEVWSEQAKKEIKPIVDQAFSGDPYFINTGVGFEEKLINDLKGGIPNYKEMREQYPNDYSEGINIYVIKDVSNPIHEAQRI